MISQPKVDGLSDLLAEAAHLRDRGKGRVVSFSPKIFLPLTRLCRDLCGYCVFRQGPRPGHAPYMSPEEVLAVAWEGERRGCREALLVLGERPEERYPEARSWLRSRGYDSTLEYLEVICRLLLTETSLYPHSNTGTLTRSELEALKKVNASLGLIQRAAALRRAGLAGRAR